MATAVRRGHHRIAIEDVCFPNEAGFVRELGGQLWRIMNTSADAVAPRHISERFVRWLNVDDSIRNDGPLDALERAVTHKWLDAFEGAHHGIG